MAVIQKVLDQYFFLYWGNNFIQNCEFFRMKTKNILEKIYFDDRIDDNLMNQNINIFVKLEICDLRKLRK